jgi:hypothetical protein
MSEEEIQKIELPTDQPELDEYPEKETDKFKILDAVTVYKFINDSGKSGYWLAVLLVETKWEHWQTKELNTSTKVVIYRWKYREKYKREDDGSFTGTGKYSWFREQQLSFGNPSLWEKIKLAGDQITELLPE